MEAIHSAVPKKSNKLMTIPAWRCVVLNLLAIGVHTSKLTKDTRMLETVKADRSTISHQIRQLFGNFGHLIVVTNTNWIL